MKKNALTPLDFVVHQIMSQFPDVILRNRIVWTFGHGAHGRKRFSGRHETILWYTKGDEYCFDLDSVRVPQLYPGKRHYKGPNKGKFSGNPLGKNPGDVWKIPNVKAKHVEKTDHPCQFPIALAKRLIEALAPVDGVVLDPFCGSGTTGVAAVLAGRRFVGAETHEQYVRISDQRICAARDGRLEYRLDRPVRVPNPAEAVSKRPNHFAVPR